MDLYPIPNRAPKELTLSGRHESNSSVLSTLINIDHMYLTYVHYMYACTCTCMCVCTYVCMYTFTTHLSFLPFVHVARIARPLYTLGGLTGAVCGFLRFEVWACCGLMCGAMHIHVLVFGDRHPVPTHLPRQGFFYFPRYIDIVWEGLAFDIAASLTTAGSRDSQLPASGLETTTPVFLTRRLRPLGHPTLEVRRGEYWRLGVFLLQYFPLVKIWKLLHYNCINMNIVG